MKIVVIVSAMLTSLLCFYPHKLLEVGEDEKVILQPSLTAHCIMCRTVGLFFYHLQGKCLLKCYR